MIKTYTIATIASHSSLQILKGAKDEGFGTIAIAIEDKISFYQRFKFIDKVIGIDTYGEFYDLENKLKKYNPIIIPHGSFVAYLGKGGDEKLSLPYFGSKSILDVEGDRQKQHVWLKQAGLVMPKVFKSVGDVDCPVIVKLYGAKGGSGYFIADSKKEISEKIKRKEFDKEKYFIQEYIVGVGVYLQYFYSIMHNRLELMGIDRRYETNIDGIGRIPYKLQKNLDLDPTYTVIGNFPIVLRESLLPEVYKMGEKVVINSRKLLPPRGLWGPFCLEMIVTPDQQFYCIEISCRIVAGTNLYINGSPYSDLFFGESMSTGRRIACEIKEAIEKDKLHLVID